MANPDPSMAVGWGEQTWEEVLFASVQFLRSEEPEEEPTITLKTRRDRYQIGFMDTDLSGFVEADECLGKLKEAFEKNPEIDSDGDGRLSLAELEVL